MHKKLFFLSLSEKGYDCACCVIACKGNSHEQNHLTVPAKALPVPTCSPGIAMLAAGPLFPANR